MTLRPQWLMRLLVWLWHRLTFKRTRELIKSIMTDHSDTYTMGRVVHVLGCLGFFGFTFHHVVIQSKDFDPMTYSGGLSALLIAGGVGVWMDAKATKTEATVETPPAS